MLDLRFADAADRAKFTCSRCKPQVMEGRKCQEPGFQNLRGAMPVSKGGQKYSFCPGKSTWYEHIAELYDQCLVACETGILPKEGGISDQDEQFAGVFPFFIERWRDKRYQRVWSDVSEFTNDVLKTVAKMFSGKR